MRKGDLLRADGIRAQSPADTAQKGMASVRSVSGAAPARPTVPNSRSSGLASLRAVQERRRMPPMSTPHGPACPAQQQERRGSLHASGAAGPARQADVGAMVLERGGGAVARQLHHVGGLAVHAQRVLVRVHRQRRVERVPVAQRAVLRAAARVEAPSGAPCLRRGADHHRARSRGMVAGAWMMRVRPQQTSKRPGAAG